MKERRKKKYIQEREAILHIGAGLNNVILALTKKNGDLIAQLSAGGCGFKNCRKSTPHAIQTAINEMMKRASERHGVKSIDVIIKGFGIARDMVSLLNGTGISIESLEDRTCIAYNGCRKSRDKRG